MPPSRRPLEFFLDRGLGRYVVPNALRAAGMTVHTMADVYGIREQAVPDVEWLAEAGERRWVVLGKDRRIRWRPAELEAIAARRVRAFVLARGTLTGLEQAKCFLDHRSRIEAEAAQPGPFVFLVYRNQIRKLWP